MNGTWVALDGTKREKGIWASDGSPSGGTIEWDDGHVYTGDWKAAIHEVGEIPDGAGSMTWPEGRMYVGRFRDGLMDGQGKMTYPDGKVEEGQWKDDQFAGPVK